MRNTWAVYKVDGKTGAILWTLGGKASTFAVPDDVTTQLAQPPVEVA